MRTTLLMPAALIATFTLTGACDRQPTESSAPVGGSARTGGAAPSLASAATGTHVSRYTADGDFAQFFAGDENTYLYLSASRYGEGSISGTSLFYYVYQCTEFECTVLEAGSGTIPNEALKVTGSGRTSVDIDTGSGVGPDFFRWAGAGGRISVEWEPRKDFESRFHGTTDQRWGQIRYHSNGSSIYSIASVSGTLIGRAVPGSGYSDAQVGSSKSKTVVIIAP